MRRKEDSAGREEDHAQQLPKPACPRARAVNRRSPGDGKLEHRNSRVAPACCNWRKALTATKTQCSQKQINKYKLFWKKKKRGPAIGRRHKGAPVTLCIQWCVSKMSANFTNFTKKKGLQCGPFLPPGSRHPANRPRFPSSLAPVTWLPLETSEAVVSTAKVLSAPPL